MRGLIHPFSKALYEVTEDGLVQVSLNGQVGLFTPSGRYVSGEIRNCDPQVCGWVGGPQIANHRVMDSKE